MPLLDKRAHRRKIDLTPSIERYIKENCTKVGVHDMAAHLGVSHSKIQSWRKELQLIGTRVEGLTYTEKVEEETELFSWGIAAQQDFILFRQ